MLRRFFPIFFALIIGFQPAGEVFFYLWYITDNDSFTRTFCVNLEKPELQCHGQCHLAAMSPVKKDGNASPAAPPVAFPKPHSLDSVLPPEALLRHRISCLTTIEPYPYHPDPRVTLLVYSIFQPPED